MKKAAPLPVLRTLAQSALHRIPMNVAQFLHELGIATHIVVVIRFCQKCSASPINFRDTPCLRDFIASARVSRSGSTQQTMHVFRHDDIPINAKPEAPTHAFQGFFEDSAALAGPQQDTAITATEHYKITLPGVMKTFESGRHA